MTADFPRVETLARFVLGIDPSKVADYLLNPDHEKGRAKAAFFTRFGFTREASGDLAVALLEHAWAATDLTCKVHPRGFGVMINVVGTIECPDERKPTIKSCWRWVPDERVASGDGLAMVARLVTAIPLTDHISIVK